MKPSWNSTCRAGVASIGFLASAVLVPMNSAKQTKKLRPDTREHHLSAPWRCLVHRLHHQLTVKRQDRRVSACKPRAFLEIDVLELSPEDFRLWFWEELFIHADQFVDWVHVQVLRIITLRCCHGRCKLQLLPNHLEQGHVGGACVFAFSEVLINVLRRRGIAARQELLAYPVLDSCWLVMPFEKLRAHALAELFLAWPLQTQSQWNRAYLVWRSTYHPVPIPEWDQGACLMEEIWCAKSEMQVQVCVCVDLYECYMIQATIACALCAWVVL